MTADRRKPPPQVIEEGDVELPQVVQSEQAVIDASRNQAEPKTHYQFLELKKLTFGQQLIGWALFLIVVLSLVTYIWPPPSGEHTDIQAAIELLKLVTTTALGYVFAKTQGSSSRDE